MIQAGTFELWVTKCQFQLTCSCEDLWLGKSTQPNHRPFDKGGYALQFVMLVWKDKAIVSKLEQIRCTEPMGSYRARHPSSKLIYSRIAYDFVVLERMHLCMTAFKEVWY